MDDFSCSGITELALFKTPCDALIFRILHWSDIQIKFKCAQRILQSTFQPPTMYELYHNLCNFHKKYCLRPYQSDKRLTTNIRLGFPLEIQSPWEKDSKPTNSLSVPKVSSASTRSEGGGGGFPYERGMDTWQIWMKFLKRPMWAWLKLFFSTAKRYYFSCLIGQGCQQCMVVFFI